MNKSSKNLKERRGRYFYFVIIVMSLLASISRQACLDVFALSLPAAQYVMQKHYINIKNSTHGECTALLLELL